ncbi:MAG: phosphocholine cytidylyltransferase family protein [Myxococcales bacterium]|nr:phosphocholine cytidylyltransferase family protein [Myxococcales bacterium]
MIAVWHLPHVKAVLLAAGTSTRLRPLTDHLPKCLLPVGDKPILARAFDSLCAAGVTEFVIVTGYLEEQIHAAVGANASHLAVTLVSNPVYATTNNAYSLWLARAALAGSGMLLLDADVIFDAKIIRHLLASPHEDCLALRASRTLGAEEMKAVVDERGCVRTISKQVDPALAAGESIGVHRFSPATTAKLLATIGERITGQGLVNEWYEASFQQLIDEGLDLFTVDVGDAYCAEIDTAEDLAIVDAAVRGRALS